MWLWKTKKQHAQQVNHDLVEDRSQIEVIAHKRATKRTISQTKRVNANLNELLEKNGITLQIHLATHTGAHKNAR